MFNALDVSTQKVRRGILERFCQNGDDGDKPFALLEPKHIIRRRKAMADRPEAANNMVKALRQLFKFAIAEEMIDRNPAALVELNQSKSEGHHSWTLDEIAQYEATHPVGTPARLALALALYTTQRRSDVVVFGPQHVKDGHIVFTQFKNRNNRPVRLEVPILPELQRIIDATPCGDLAFLVTAYGKPYTVKGFGERFKKWCVAAGLPHCSIHGLRKAGAVAIATKGATHKEIMSFTGHRTAAQVDRYIRAAEQKKLAGRVLKRMAGEQS